MRAWWAPALPVMLPAILLTAGCGDALLIAEEALPPGTELKVVSWSDGAAPGAVLRAAQDPSVIPLAGSLDAGRTLRLAVFPFTRAELDAAIPGLAGLSIEEVLAGVVPELSARIPMPGASPVLEAEIDGDSDEAVYRPVPRATWDASVAAGERTPTGLSVPDALACRWVQPIDVIELPSSFVPAGAAAVDGDRLLIAGTTGTTTFQLLDVRVGGVREVTVRAPGLARPDESMAWDPTSATLWGRDSRGTLYRLDADGMPVAFPEPPRLDMDTVSAGRDGTVVAIDARYNAEGGISTYVLEPGRTTWTTTEGFRNFPTRGGLRAYGNNRFIANINCHTRAWDFDRDTGTWAWGLERASDAHCGLFPRDQALDASQYLWLGDRGTLRVGHDDDDGVWPERPHGIPITSTNIWPLALAAMEDGRMAVAGTRGQVEVWIGDRWCLPSEVPTPDVSLALGSGVDGTAWFVGTDAGPGTSQTKARAIRIRLGP